MLDKRSAKLLKTLARICEDGSFKIIETSDMAKAVSKKADFETIQPILKFLSNNSMIDIKYSDKSKFCVSVLPEGRLYIEKQNSKMRDVVLSRRMIAAAIAGSFIAAFVGGVLASVIMKLFGM